MTKKEKFLRLMSAAKIIDKVKPAFVDTRLLIEHLPVDGVDDLLRWYDAELIRQQTNVCISKMN